MCNLIENFHQCSAIMWVKSMQIISVLNTLAKKPQPATNEVLDYNFQGFFFK